MASDLEAEKDYEALLERERAAWWDSGNFDKWKTHYLNEYPRGRFILEALAAYVPEFSPRGARVLDVGCGDAGIIIAFAEAGARVCGVEPSGSSLARAAVRARGHGVEVGLVRGVAESLPFPDGSFDLVVMDNVLEHVDDRERSIAEIRRVLRPGGLLYLVTPKPFAAQSIVSDPHYELFGLVLLPRRVQKWYFERVRGGGEGAYAVGVIPTRWGVRRLLRGAGFRLLASPRDLWIRYLRSRIAAPAEVRPGLRRRLARYLSDREEVFRNPVVRWALDLALGSNFFIARRLP